MTLQLMAVLLCLASLFGFVNYRILHLPPTVALLIMSLIAAAAILGLEAFVPQFGAISNVRGLLVPGQLPQTFLNGLLAFLLFAGALNVTMDDLWSRKGIVLSLATLGVVICTVLYGLGIWALFLVCGSPMPLTWCIVLGAILAPTDPIAVGPILRSAGLTPAVQAVIAGESLLNDGVGVVVFNTALTLGVLTSPYAQWQVLLNALWETGGAVAIGLATGWIGYQLMKQIDDYRLEVTVSLAVATGGYALAQLVDVSGPVAVVISGLLIGSLGRKFAMSDLTRRRLSEFWEMTDELLNTVLFLVIGLELLNVRFDGVPPVVLLAAAPLALWVRLVAIVVTTRWLDRGGPLYWRWAGVITWGGLRGGISVAMALILPPGPWTGPVLLITYTVVVFSIVVQGLTMKRLARVANV